MPNRFIHLFNTSSRLLLILLLCGSGLSSKAQTTITQWNFNSAFTILANGNAPAPSTGSGSMVLIGGVTADNAVGTPSDLGNPNNGLNTTTYPAQSMAPKTSGISINVNTTGFNNLHLKFYIRHSGSAAKKVVVQYYDGTVWQDVFIYLAASTNFSNELNIDLSTYAALNNNTAAQLRLVTDFSSGTNYDGATGAYISGVNGGTIRYDLITVVGNTLACAGPATQQATGLRLLKTDANSAQLTLNRGNGGGCLVVCSNSGIPSAPVNNTVYIANPSFTNGAAIGNGFTIYNTRVNNPSIQYFNITNLTAGTKYYLAAYEYSNSGNCYLTPALIDSFYCNSTVLYPGDMQFIGYDNDVATGGRDAFVLTNFAPLTTGTSFQIVNARYEAGAPANTRTNRWYAGGNNIYQNIQKIKLLYTGTAPLLSGSVISFDFEAPTASNIKINGVASGNFSIISENVVSGNSMLSTSAAEQFFITQGKFTAYGVSGVNQYAILDGHVLHGISYTNNWVDFGAVPGAGTSNADRQSRIPPDITGLNLFFSTGDFAYYNPLSLNVGSQGALLSAINQTPANWISGASTGINQIIPAVLSSTFAPNRLTAAGTWTGIADNNWFNALNWQGGFVPDSLTDVTIPVNKIPLISAIAPFANLYNRVATTRALTIASGGTLTLNGPAGDKLIVYDSLLVDATGNITGSFRAVRGIDTIVLRGNLQRRDGAEFQAFDSSFFSLDGNRLLQPIDIWLVTGTLYNVRTVAINNLPGVRLLNGGIETLQDLWLTNGIFSIINGTAIYYFGQNCNIISPANIFGESNRGWGNSFIDGRINIRTGNITDTLTAPVGSAAKDIFAPMVFITNTDINAGNRTYSASYIPVAHPNISPADIATPPLDHVSGLEYWTLNSLNSDAAAKITLYYTPYSRVGQGGNDAQALLDLRIAQYWDSISGGGVRKWRLYGLGGPYVITGNVNYGKITYNQFATDLSFGSQNFTLGTVSLYNTLPIQLISWIAVPQGNRVQLRWQVADESDVTFYTIEKSTDGLHYSPLQTISKAINFNNVYIRYDDKPLDGWNYYRLKATGTDGKTFYSAIQKVWYISGRQWLVYPNPATDVLWLQLPAAGTVTLYTLDGKIILQRWLPASLNRLNIKSFAKGMYVLEYFDGRQRRSEKIRLQ